MLTDPMRAEIEIDAPAERVWDVLVDVGAYGEWNPFMTSVTGQVAPGSRLRVRLEAPGTKARTVDLRVREVDPPRRLRWTGAFPRYHVPGLLIGERVIELEPLPGDRVRVVNTTTFRGLLVWAIRWMYAYESGFDSMNRALKRRVETAARPGASR
jgi:hypothetical protein